MNIKVIALASIIGLSAPAVIDVVNPSITMAMPTDFVRPTGSFMDTNQEWILKLNLDQFGVYTYDAQNRKNGDSLTIKNPEVFGNSQHYTYTFKNNNYKYIVDYQPADKKNIRLTVINPQGKTVLNKLMTKVGNDWDV